VDVDRVGRQLDQRPVALLALAQRLRGAPLRRPVAHDLEEARCRGAPQRHEQARGPEAAPVLAQVRALVLGPPLGGGLRHLGLGCAPFPVLGREQEAAVHAERLGLVPAEEVAGAHVPGRDPALGVEGEDRVAGGAVQDRA
jgi:hypothetical protein